MDEHDSQAYLIREASFLPYTVVNTEAIKSTSKLLKTTQNVKGWVCTVNIPLAPSLLTCLHPALWWLPLSLHQLPVDVQWLFPLTWSPKETHFAEFSNVQTMCDLASALFWRKTWSDTDPLSLINLLFFFFLECWICDLCRYLNLWEFLTAYRWINEVYFVGLKTKLAWEYRQNAWGVLGIEQPHWVKHIFKWGSWSPELWVAWVTANVKEG